jgi:hypothetical protein
MWANIFRELVGRTGFAVGVGEERLGEGEGLGVRRKLVDGCPERGSVVEWVKDGITASFVVEFRRKFSRWVVDDGRLSSGLDLAEELAEQDGFTCARGTHKGDVGILGAFGNRNLAAQGRRIVGVEPLAPRDRILSPEADAVGLAGHVEQVTVNKPGASANDAFEESSPESLVGTAPDEEPEGDQTE